jgi:hypothetical protein
MIKDKRYWLNKRQRKINKPPKEHHSVHIHITDVMLLGDIPPNVQRVELPNILNEQWVIRIKS